MFLRFLGIEAIIITIPITKQVKQSGKYINTFNPGLLSIILGNKGSSEIVIVEPSVRAFLFFI